MRLRETAHYLAVRVNSGVRITAKEKNVQRQSRVVSERTWEALSTMNDASFDGSCVLELGIGTYIR